jgi:hypothetical protein
MCRPCLNTAHVYKEDDMLALDVRSQCLIQTKLSMSQGSFIICLEHALPGYCCSDISKL